MQRVGEPALGHGEPGRPQRLRRDLTAVEVVGERSARVVRPVEVAVELLEVEQLLERRRRGGARGTRPSGDGIRAVVAPRTCR